MEKKKCSSLRLFLPVLLIALALMISTGDAMAANPDSAQYSKRALSDQTIKGQTTVLEKHLARDASSLSKRGESDTYKLLSQEAQIKEQLEALYQKKKSSLKAATV